jgi:galactarate dehydratase
MDPRLVRVHPTDNVAIVVDREGLPAGTSLHEGLVLREAVPQSHKIALHDIAENAPIVRYGTPIAFAARAIPRGAWVREELLTIPPAPELDELPLATAVPSPRSPLEGFTVDGYPNADGTVGARNILALTTTVQCVVPTVEFAAARIRQEILPRYPGVDDVVALGHSHGCGVAIEAPGAAIPIRTVRNLALNPNLGGETLVVSLGCEKLQPDRLFPPDEGYAGSGVELVRLQDDRHNGFTEMVASIMEAAEQRLAVLARRRRVACPASDLVVGLQCGGSDAFSGVTANPAVGHTQRQ